METVHSEKSIVAWPDSLIDGSEMAKRTHTFNWNETGLGPIESWPQTLRVHVGMALSNSFPMAIIWGREFTQIYNDAFIPIAGHNHPSMLGNACWNTWNEIWHDILEPTLLKIKQTGKAIITESQHFPVLRFGYLEEVYCLVAYSPLRNDNNEIEGFLITISETTGQVLGERRLKTLCDLGARTAEAKCPREACQIAMETLMQSATDIPFSLIYLLDDAGRKVDLIGTSGFPTKIHVMPETVTLPFDESVEPWPFSKVLSDGPQQIDNLERKLDVLPGSYWPETPRTAVVLPLGSQRQRQPLGFLVAGISPRRELDEQYREFLTLIAAQIAASITNAQAYEKELSRAEALAKLDRAKTTFFSNISHEFRTPLSLILGPIEDLLKRADIPPEHTFQLDIIHRNTLRLLKLVNSLLDFSQIEAGRLRASYRPTDLTALTLDLVSHFRSATEKAGLTLRTECPPLPQPVYVDRDLWEKIVLNLLSNAFKHTFQGQIEIRLQGIGDQVILRVRDTGVGIPEEQLPHLFERFHRVPNMRARTHEGTGIGLALVKELVHLHGGTISVQSIPDQGSTFTVSIPAGKTHLPADRCIEDESSFLPTTLNPKSFIEESLRGLPEAVSTPVAHQDTTNRPRIVLAEDNADMLNYIQRLMEPFYEVIAAGDGEMALAAIQNNLPDLVLTDVMMPRLDGFGLLRELRRRPKTKTLPVIMLSARAGEEASIEGFEAGATDYLVKPFSANELLARVGINLEMSRLRKEAEEKVRQSEKMKVIGQLAGGVAHDFNTLLTVLIGRLEMLDEYVADESGKRILRSALSAAERGAKLVKQILAFARKQPLRLEKIDLNNVIFNMEDLIASTLQKNHQLQKMLTEHIWPVLADVNQMEMIILNLVVNARDAMSSGGTLTIATQNIHYGESPDGELKPGDYILFSVSDTGRGMSPEVLAQAFEPFFTTKEIGAGTGLGLSQVYGTVKQLGGGIKLHSTLEQGTRIEIFLPSLILKQH